MRAVSSLYSDTLNKVVTGSEEHTWFETRSGVRHGCVLSPSLFILYIDLAIKEVAVGQKVTNILEYADDIAQLASSEDDSQHYMTK